MKKKKKCKKRRRNLIKINWIIFFLNANYLSLYFRREKFPEFAFLIKINIYPRHIIEQKFYFFHIFELRCFFFVFYLLFQQIVSYAARSMIFHNVFHDL